MQNKIVVFSGAGMSAESGIQTFRDSNGLWEEYNIHDVATPDAWLANPDLVTEFYNQRRKQIVNAEPNDAHKTLADLQNSAEVQVITQNIDDLHERAGSQNVLHLHGNIRYAKSSGPNSDRELFRVKGTDLSENDLWPSGFRLRPHVVWFGEAVPMMEKAIQIMGQSTHFIVIGSSLQVYPAANLITHCPAGARKWIIDPNVQEINNIGHFTLIKQSAVEGIKTVLKEIRL